VSMKISVKPTELKKVISLLEAEHPDVEDLARQVVTELKGMWVKQDQYVVHMLDPAGRAIYTFGVHYTPSQAQKELTRLTSPGPGPTQGWVPKVRGVPDDV
jgi:hypothetical protein